MNHHVCVTVILTRRALEACGVGGIVRRAVTPKVMRTSTRSDKLGDETSLTNGVIANKHALVALARDGGARCVVIT